MATARLEHVNITVSDPERSARFLADLCGWQERWRGPAINNGRTIHIGSDSNYVALYTTGAHPDGNSPATKFEKGRPLNHIGLVVDDLETAKRIVQGQGFEILGQADYEPGQRFYFVDWDGIEFEVVSYTERPAFPTT